jgi:hypothetical protein
LAQYQLQLFYTKGSAHGKPDALSRRSDHEEQHVSKQFTQVLPAWENEPLSPEDIMEISEEEKTSIIKQHHNPPYIGHPGIHATMSLLKRLGYEWPKMIDKICAYIKKCAPCQQSKHNNRKEAGELRPTEILDRPWQHITIDLITDLPKSKGYNSILVIVNKFLKMVRYIPCTKKITAQETAQHLTRLYDLIGIPEKIISDRGPQFATKYTQEFNCLLGIETALSTAYHPQTDGQTERVNQELENYLQMYCRMTPTQWVDWLSLAEAAHNGRYHISTGMMPHMIFYGYDKKTLDDVKRMQSDNDVAQEFVSDKKEMWKIVKANLLKAQQDMKRHADASRRPITFKKGDHVWLSTADLQGIHKKLGPLRLGPFEITDTVRDNPNAYQLQLPPTMKIHPVINVS